MDGAGGLSIFQLSSPLGRQTRPSQQSESTQQLAASSARSPDALGLQPARSSRMPCSDGGRLGRRCRPTARQPTSRRAAVHAPKENLFIPPGLTHPRAPAPRNSPAGSWGRATATWTACGGGRKERGGGCRAGLSEQGCGRVKLAWRGPHGPTERCADPITASSLVVQHGPLVVSLVQDHQACECHLRAWGGAGWGGHGRGRQGHCQESAHAQPP